MVVSLLNVNAHFTNFGTVRSFIDITLSGTYTNDNTNQ